MFKLSINKACTYVTFFERIYLLYFELKILFLQYNNNINILNKPDDTIHQSNFKVYFNVII